jgi:hypothetical protein
MEVRGFLDFVEFFGVGLRAFANRRLLMDARVELHDSKPGFGGLVYFGERAGAYQVCKAELQSSQYRACASKDRR